MVKAILDGRKTQTRRAIRNPLRYEGLLLEGEGQDWCPYGRSGDQLWVREAWRQNDSPSICVHYRADPDECSGGPWRPSIHMPRWASRLTLEITEVRVQRLQDISEEDAIAEGLRSQEGDGGAAGAGFKWRGTGYEGARPGYFHTPGDGRCGCNVGGPTPAQCAYSDLWESINRKRAPWASNPWVWAISFRKVG